MVGGLVVHRTGSYLHMWGRGGCYNLGLTEEGFGLTGEGFNGKFLIPKQDWNRDQW